MVAILMGRDEKMENIPNVPLYNFLCFQAPLILWIFQMKNRQGREIHALRNDFHDI